MISTEPRADSEFEYRGMHGMGTFESRSKHVKLKSGIDAKQTDHVLNPQLWPHSLLQDEFVSRELKFFDLNFIKFVEGELEIISLPEISESERNGRLAFLKLLSYHANATNDNKQILQWYAAWLRRIELNQRSWDDDPREIEFRFIRSIYQKNYTYSLNKKQNFSSNTMYRQSQSVNPDVWFCNWYQKNKCTLGDNHEVKFKGVVKTVQHICATCWLKDKLKSKHPECSIECPYQQKQTFNPNANAWS